MTDIAAPARWRLGYRPELDGLRGVAIAMVLTMHATGYTRGTLGVLVFFVLSGFLITALLLEELDRGGRVALGSFYVRRAVRLLPALGAVLLCVGTWMVIAGDAESIPGQFIPAALYYMNWIAMHGPVGSVGHTWSLAIEEQFYLLWPILLLGIMSVGGRRLALATTLAAVAVSVGLRFILADPAAVGRAYYGSDTNAYALLLGCALAIAATGGWLPSIPRWLSFGSALTLGLVFTVNQSEVGALTFGDTLGATAATIGIAALVTMPHRHPILAARPLVGLGRISYGLYLVHIPVRTVIDATIGTDPLWLRAVLIVAVSLVVAMLLWRIVEAPAQRIFRESTGSRSRRPLAHVQSLPPEHQPRWGKP